MPAADVVRARIDTETKNQAAAVLAEMGLSVSDAIRMLLVKVAAEHALPFELRVPNATTKAALRSAKAKDVASFVTVSDLMTDLHDDDPPA